jgi:hypothetical protein
MVVGGCYFFGPRGGDKERVMGFGGMYPYLVGWLVDGVGKGVQYWNYMLFYIGPWFALVAGTLRLLIWRHMSSPGKLPAV